MTDEVKYWEYRNGERLIHWNFKGLNRRYNTDRMIRISECLYESVAYLNRDLSEKGFEFSILICDRGTIRKLKKEYFGVECDTDVIAISMLEGEFSQFCGSMLGDIYLCHDVVRENAGMLSVKVEKEIAFVLLHGLLHLFSYDDNDADGKNEMFELQKKLMDDYFSEQD